MSKLDKFYTTDQLFNKLCSLEMLITISSHLSRFDKLQNTHLSYNKAPAMLLTAWEMCL